MFKTTLKDVMAKIFVFHQTVELFFDVGLVNVNLSTVDIIRNGKEQLVEQRRHNVCSLRAPIFST